MTLQDTHKKLRKRRLQNIPLNFLCILIAGSGLIWVANYFWKYIHYEITNDAFIDQYVSPLNIRASGYIKEVRFKEHQYVHQGDTLLILDNREYQIKVKEAEAALLDVKGSKEVLHSGIETSQTNIAVQDANIAEAKAKLWQLEQDYRRFARLLKEESVPEQQYEQAKASYKAAQARYQALLEQRKAAQSQFTETTLRTTSAEAAILSKEASLDLARLNLSYTVLTAPYDGYMGRRTLEPGQYVQAGQTISYLVRNTDKWVTANYKETQIIHIYIGQEVRIKVDALPGKVFHGTVTAISEATGSKYSLVPTDNSAGMAIAYPIVPKVLDALSSKFLLLTDLSIQFLLSWVCARSQNIDLVIIYSFFIGFLKGFLMLWFIRRATKIFSPKNVRSEFYSYFYPLVFAGGQVSMIVTAELAYHYNWQYMYYFMMMMLMASILIVIVCFRHNRPLKPIRLSELHIREMLVIATGLLMLMYVINYGKVLDWMSSFKIRLYLVIAPILIAFFIWKQYHSKQPYVNLAPLYQPKAIVGYLYMMLVMFFSTSTTLLTNYMTSILKVDSTHTYQLYIYLLPGYALGAFICFWWFRWQRWRFRFLIAGGMSCFAAFFGILYFTVSPESTYEMLFLPVFLRGLGMLVLIIAFALFAVEELNPKFLLANAFFLICFRSVLAPILATSFYSNTLYRLEQKYMYSLSETISQTDPLAASQFNQSLTQHLAQGHEYTEATQMATQTLYATLQQQSLLLSLKHILGYLFVISLVIAIVSRFIPFHKTIRVKYTKAGDDMV
ncbi:MFS transporter [Phocaeicola plebeius]|uniref:MFS transporter n=1 Tax=Phocaeicola plebeius TaxID=310297 RepID=UPI002420343B|nr:MFS transporter [Phocaeicola plebeius]